MWSPAVSILNCPAANLLKGLLLCEKPQAEDPFISYTSSASHLLRDVTVFLLLWGGKDRCFQSHVVSFFTAHSKPSQMEWSCIALEKDFHISWLFLFQNVCCFPDNIIWEDCFVQNVWIWYDSQVWQRLKKIPVYFLHCIRELNMLLKIRRLFLQKCLWFYKYILKKTQTFDLLLWGCKGIMSPSCLQDRHR